MKARCLGYLVFDFWYWKNGGRLLGFHCEHGMVHGYEANE
ncbi:hypothetical protein D104_03590 [Marinomonas profundimaris]|jgi:hypothetical protein|uniref:Uncharacterized protein n=1 Tax=Marinomonas profundimaris TaxID=1208321 RepID=W1RYV6_9GAMM|nr:hypothetical protein D104_03590 [Marinomonas profundimaris]